MMGNIMRYSGLITKTRAMGGKLLTGEELEGLTELATVNEAISYLKQTEGYRRVFAGSQGAWHRGAAEEIITKSLYEDFERLYRFADATARQPFSYVFFRYEVDLVKDCLQYLFQKQRTGREVYVDNFFERHTRFSLEGLKNAASLPELEQGLGGTVYEPVFAKLQAKGECGYADYATALDIFYYTSVYREIRRKRRSTLRSLLLEIYGTQIDWLNIMWIYRSIRFYRQSQAELYASLIPYTYRLKRAELHRMTGISDTRELVKLLAETGYFKGKEAFIRMEDEISYRRVIDTVYQRVSLRYAVSVAPVLRYLHEKGQEIERLTSIIEGIRYQIPPKEIRDIILL